MGTPDHITHIPQFIVIHTVKGFSIVKAVEIDVCLGISLLFIWSSEAEVDVLLEFSCFSYDPTDVGSLMSGPSDFSKSSLYIWNFSVHALLKSSLKDFEQNLTSM